MSDYELADACGNSICHVHSSRELFALIRTLRRLDPVKAERLYHVVFHDPDGSPTTYRLGDVLH
jgi:hypothetical protein